MNRALVAVFVLASIPARAAMPEAESAQFRADLDLLARELPRRHASLYHHTERADFQAAVSALHDRLPSLERHEAVVELARIVALARDGHSALFLLPFPGAAPVSGIHQLPVQLYSFPDGLRVVAIAREHAAWLGARVESIGGVPAEEALLRVAAILPQDNAMGPRDLGPFVLALPEALAALKLAPGPDRAELELVGENGRTRLVLTPMTTAPDSAWVDRFVHLPGPRETWVGGGDAAATPRWLSREGEPWWFTTLEDGTVYAQISAMRDTPAEKFAGFVERLLAAVPRTGAPKLVLDLRLNRGGNGDLAWALVHGIVRHDVVNQPGRLFVLTGRRTFSAAQLLANALEKHTRSLFVGEPTGSSPNHYGELGTLSLPGTHHIVYYSQLYWQHDPRDRRPWIPPHVAAELTWDDFAAGRDPVLAAALAYTPVPTVASVMGELVESGRTAEAVAAFRRAATAHRNPWRNLFERELNDAGYGLLEAKREKDAVLVLGLAAELYPESWNAWDSLGEVHLAAGTRHRAAYCYARSVRLNPKNDQGADALLQILEGE